MRSIRAILTLAILAAPAAAAETDTEYAAVFLFDEKIGHLIHTRTVDGDKIIHEETLNLNIMIRPRPGERGPRRVNNRRIIKRFRYVETAAGEPLEFVVSSGAGMFAGKTRGVIRDGQIDLEVTQGGQTTTTTVPYPEGALMPEGALRVRRRHGLSQGKRYMYDQFVGQHQIAVPVEVKIRESTVVPLLGWTTTLTHATATYWVGEPAAVCEVDMDATCEIVRAPTVLEDTYHIRLVGATRALAMANDNKPFDLRTAPSIRAPKPIARPRQAKRMRFVVAPATEGVHLLFPDTQEQKVTLNPDGTVTLDVSITETAAGSFPYLGNDEMLTRMSSRSMFVQSNNSRVIRSQRKITRGLTDSISAARKIEAWVTDYLSVAEGGEKFGSAMKALASHAGDSTEHALLTAGLCRAAGIPCRVLTGVVYMPQQGTHRNAFVPHMWNQVYIDGTWVSLDAEIGSDAARIAMATGTGEAVTLIGVLTNMRSINIVSAAAE